VNRSWVHATRWFTLCHDNIGHINATCLWFYSLRRLNLISCQVKVQCPTYVQISCITFNIQLPIKDVCVYFTVNLNNLADFSCNILIYVLIFSQTFEKPLLKLIVFELEIYCLDEHNLFIHL